MISVDEALGHIFDLVTPTGCEMVSLREASGRIIARPVVADRDQPPFAASVMDGYAVPDADPMDGKTYAVVGAAAAGQGFDGSIAPGQAVRIFTGAPVPHGASRVLIQEDVDRDEDRITLRKKSDSNIYIREIGADFKAGDSIDPPLRLTPAHVALIAAMNAPAVAVAKRPVVALIATGDELVMPGETPGFGQIIASNTFGIAAALKQEGAAVRTLPIARDDKTSLETCFRLAHGADLVVTIGGASVGDHDLVREVAHTLGMDRAFYRIAMRPGKPLMAGRIGKIPMVGLPGNPVSAFVCTHIFLRPMIRAMQGLPPAPMPLRVGSLTDPIAANGPRQHYMRATLEGGLIKVAERQDSALLTVLAGANVLVVRPPHDPARDAGTTISYLEL